MRHFRLPLVVTGITLALVLMLGIAGVAWIHRSAGSQREKELRSQRLGSGAATATSLVIAPFWVFAAARLGKERRAAGDAARAKPGRRR